MKNTVTTLSALLFALALFAGCGDDVSKPKGTGAKTGTDKTTHVGHVHACPDCGYLEDKCLCAKGGEKCEKCGMIEGSPGCCDAEFIRLINEAKKNKEDVHIVICEECGNIEGGERCCEKDKGFKICAKCGKHEGSFMCRQMCGVKKAAEPSEKKPEEKKAGEKKPEEKQPEKKKAEEKKAEEKKAEEKKTDEKE